MRSVIQVMVYKSVRSERTGAAEVLKHEVIKLNQTVTGLKMLVKELDVL